MDNPHADIPKPHPGQQKILAREERTVVAVCGRRFGKTVAGGLAALRRCEQSRQRVWWVAPIQEQSDRAERQIAEWLSPLLRRPQSSLKKKSDDNEPRSSTPVWEHRKSEHALVCVSNGSRIEFHSAQSPDHLRGAGLDLLIIDEAADVDPYAWKAVLRPMLLESKGSALILGTPRGTGHWLHRLFISGEEKTDAPPKVASIRLPTTENPAIDAAELEAHRADMSEDEFRQEFLAEFLDGIGTVFRNIDGVVDELTLLACGRRGDQYITGVDFGDLQDYTVICSLSTRTNRLDGFERYHKLGWCEQVERLCDHLQRFPGFCIVDATGVGRPVHDMLRERYGGPLIALSFTADRKRDLVQALQVGLERKRFAMPKIDPLLNELRTYEATRMGETISYSAPPGLHDDCVIALGLAWWQIFKHERVSRGWDNPLQEGFY